MAPDIPKIDPDRHPNLGDAAWNFGDEVLRWFFHGHSLSDSKACSSHFSATSKSKFLKTRGNPVLREVRRRVTTHHDVAGSAHILGLRGRELRNLIVLSFCYLLFQFAYEKRNTFTHPYHHSIGAVLVAFDPSAKHRSSLIDSDCDSCGYHRPRDCLVGEAPGRPRCCRYCGLFCRFMRRFSSPPFYG